jgi:hypothetical protein
MGIKLNFSDDANFSGNTPEGNYDLTITNVTPIKTDNSDGTKAMPHETPGMLVEFTVEGPSHVGMKEYTRFYFPPEDYKNKATQDGILGRFLITCGYDESDIKSGSFELEPDDLVGKCFTGHIGPQKKNPDFNEVTRLRARVCGEATAEKAMEATAGSVW